MRHPPVNGVEVLENREYMTVRIATCFQDNEDLLIAEEIVSSVLLELSGVLNVKTKTEGTTLELCFSMCFMHS